ncbi:MAG: glucose 1-dehydrogenase [Caulobacterales bacterium]
MTDKPVAIVTGAAQGIGLAIARALAQNGTRVVVADANSPDNAVAQLRSEGFEASGVIANVADEASAQNMIDHAVDAHGGLDILVNNAGIFTSLLPQPLTDITLTEWRRVMSVNMDGVFLAVKAAVPAMRRRGGGCIVNIGSATSFKGNPLMLHYVTSKSAIIGMTRALSRELGADGIRVNCIAPGYTLSEGLLQNQVQLDRGRQKNINERSVSRDMYPTDVAGAIAFLASPAAAFITGQTLVVDGGVALN